MSEVENIGSSPNCSNAVLAAVHSPEREADVQKLCDAVLNTGLSFHYNPNGADWGNCPFCWAEYHNENFEMSDIKHKPECAYHIAKDLSTNSR